MRHCYAAIRGVNTCEDGTIWSRLKRFGDARISSRPFGEAYYSEPTKEIWTLSSSTYEDSSSVRYDGKEYVESLFKVRREKSATGAVQIGESVTVKTKSRV